jgi:hypothetical protein
MRQNGRVQRQDKRDVNGLRATAGRRKWAAKETSLVSSSGFTVEICWGETYLWETELPQLFLTTSPRNSSNIRQEEKNLNRILLCIQNVASLI